MADRPDAVTAAVSLLEQCETVPDHERRATRVLEAFRLLDAFLQGNPASEHQEYIENTKRSHLRRHMLQLSEVDDPDQDTWLQNFFLFANAGREVEQVLGQRPDLRTWYDHFMQSCLEWAQRELVPALEAASKR